MNDGPEERARAEALRGDRKLFIGGSDIPKIIGESEYGDKFTLYLEKDGKLPPPAGETKVQRRGKILETPIRLMAADEWGVELIDGAVFTAPEKKAGIALRAQVDALERSGDRQVPNEIKSSSEYARGRWGPTDTDDAPTGYCAQLHWQMGMMALNGSPPPFGRIIALLGADDLRRYTLAYDTKIVEWLLGEAREFRRRVLERDPPEPNPKHPATLDTLNRLFANPKAAIISVADDKLRAWRDVLVEAQEMKAHYDKVIDAAKAHFLWNMRDAALLDFGDGQMFERKAIARKAYTVEATTYIDARLRKARGSATPLLEEK